MAQASSSRVTLDAVDVTLETSVPSHLPHRQTSTQQLESSTTGGTEEIDYDSDGFCTPPLPPSDGDIADLPTLGLAESFTLTLHQDMPTKILGPSSSSNILSSDQTPNSTLQDVDRSSPKTTKKPKKAAPASDDEYEEEEKIIVIKAEYVDALEIASSSPKPRPRGRPPGSTKAKKFAIKSDTGRRRGRPPGSTKAKKSANTGRRTGIPVGRSCTEGLPDGLVVEATASSSCEWVNGTSTGASQEQITTSFREINEKENAALEIREEEAQEKGQSSASPEKSLLPDFIFELPDDSMFAELRAFLDREEAESTVSSEDEEQEGSDIDQEAYERRRLKKLRANQAILSKLGLGDPAPSSPMPLVEIEEEEGEEEAGQRSSPDAFKKKSYKNNRRIKVDADGFTTSAPPPGCTFEVAVVSVPMLRPRIRLQHIFQDDFPILPPLPDVQFDEVDDEEEEAVEEQEEQEEEQRPPPTPRRRILGPVRRSVNGEALEGEGTSCHQCRRKTEEPKMRCRYYEDGRVCPLFWCKRCLDVRYAIEWDEDSRTFHCPRCLAYCNCSLCLHKAGLSKICSGLGAKLRNEEGNKIYPSVRHYLDAKVGRSVKTGSGGLLSRPSAGTVETDSSPSKGGSSPAKKAIKRKAAGKTSASVEPKKKKQKSGEQQTGLGPAVNADVLHLARPSFMSPEGESSRSRKIKLTFKAKATAEEEEERRQRLKHERAVRSVNVSKGRKVQFAKAPTTTIKQGQPPKSSKKSVPQIIASANVWVKSKADVAPSSSDSELEESTWRTISPHESDISDDEMGLNNTFQAEQFTSIGTDYDSDLDDGAEQDIDVDEETSSMQDTADSPQAGQIEFTHHPQLTMTESSSMLPHPVFQNNGILPFVGDVHTPFPPPDGPELTDFIQHLMGAGVI